MPKLPTNMITRKGKPGYWFQRDIHGKRVRRYLGEDFEDAKRQANDLRSEKKVIPAGPVMVREAAERWLAEYVPTTRTEKDQKTARYRVDQYLIPRLGRHRLSALEKAHLRLYRLWLERQGLKTQTVVHVLSDARCFLLWCEEEKLIDAAPFPRKGFMPKLQEREPDRVSDEDAEKLRNLPEPHGFVCRLALGTGLRWGELTRAQRSDVERGCLVVRHHTKSRKNRRVPLSQALLFELNGRTGRLVAFSVKSPGSFARATGIDGFHVHQMRHTFACQYLEAGGSLAALKQILGHADIKTTEIYAGLSDDVVKRDAERVHATLSRSADTQADTKAS